MCAAAPPAPQSLWGVHHALPTPLAATDAVFGAPEAPQALRLLEEFIRASAQGGVQACAPAQHPHPDEPTTPN